jgi:hypothetical protein
MHRVILREKKSLSANGALSFARHLSRRSMIKYVENYCHLDALTLIFDIRG